MSIVSEDAQFRQSVKALVESAGLHANTFPTLQAMLGAEALQSRGCLVFHSEGNALNDPNVIRPDFRAGRGPTSGLSPSG